MPAAKLTKLEKVQYVTLLRAESAAPRAYYLRYRDPATGKDVRQKLLQCTSRDEARAEARRTNQAVIDQRAKLRTMPAVAATHLRHAPTLRQAIDEALATRFTRHNISQEHQAALQRRAGAWLDFMAAEFPKVAHWLDVRRTPHVSQYVASLEARGISPVTVKHYLEPLSITAGYFADEHAELGYRNIQPLKAAPRLTAAPAKNYLAPAQVEKAIATALEVDQWKVALTLYMGCYCGMNLREIVWLREQDFDFSAGTVTVTRAKNEYRPRTIPAPAFVLDFVKAYLQRPGAVRPIEGYLVPPPEGKQPNDGYVSRALARVLKRANLQGIIAPKDVRKTFENLDCFVTAPEWLLDAYMGRVGNTVSRRHYRDAQREGLWRSEIVARVEALHLATCEEVGKNLAPPELAVSAGD